MKKSIKKKENKFKDYEYTFSRLYYRSKAEDSINSVFIVVDDITSIDDLDQINDFVSKFEADMANYTRTVNTSVFLDPAVQFFKNEQHYDNIRIANAILENNIIIYNTIFDSIATNCDAIYYLKLDSDYNKIDDIQKRLHDLYLEYENTKVKEIYLALSDHELPFD